MKSRLFIFIGLLGIAAIAFGWIYESRLREQISRSELVIPDNIDYFLTNLRYRAMNQAGELDYELHSRRLEHWPRTDVSHIEIPSLQIYRDQDHWRIDSQRGEFEHRENRLKLQQQVVMRRLGQQPLQLQTESISFEPDRDLVVSDTPVILTSDDARIEAERAEFNLADGIYTLNKARAIYYDADQDS